MSISDRTINYLVRLIRDHVNKPWKHYSLRQNKAMFSQLCSSMDMIDDADNAIRAYELGEYPELETFPLPRNHWRFTISSCSTRCCLSFSRSTGSKIFTF